jgi:hypothetical protein
MPHPPVGKPIAVVSNRKVLLAALANGLGRRPNMVADDFVDRLAAWAKIEKVVHCHDPLARHPSISMNDNQKQSISMLQTCNGPNNSTHRNRIGPRRHTIRDRIRMSRIEGASGGRDVLVLTREAVSGGRPLFCGQSFRTSSRGSMQWQHRNATAALPPFR